MNNILNNTNKLYQEVLKYVTDSGKEDLENFDIKKLARIFQDVDKVSDTLKKITSHITTHKKMLSEYVIPSVMEDNDITKIGIEGIGLLHTKKGVYASILKDPDGELSQEAIQYLEDRGHGECIKTKRSIHHMTLSSIVEQKIREGDELPDSIKVTPYVKAVITKNKKG